MRHVVQELLLEADIKINGTRPWDVVIHDDRVYDRLKQNMELALGESYMEGWWDCEQVDEFICRVMRADLKHKARKLSQFWRSVLTQKVFEILRGVFNFQSQRRAFMVGEQHYNIGNDLYKAMLDQRMTYTCGYWENGARDLDEAQEAKLELTCQKLKLKPGMRVLDIGCGWGSFAKYAAENYHVSVVGVTISSEQLALGKELCQGLPIKFHLQDYRNLPKMGQVFDRIVSLGMFEHVGSKNYKTYMEVAAHCLKDDGLFLLHTIGGNRSTKICASQWINKYIFPNGQTPSIQQIGKATEELFVMEDWHNFGCSYDKTLMAWHKNFNDHWESLKHKYDEGFRRMWNYYLLSCAGNFRARDNHLWQIVLSKKGVVGGYARPSLREWEEVVVKTARSVIYKHLDL